MNSLRLEIRQTELNLANNRVYIRKKYSILKNRLVQPEVLIPTMLASIFTGYIIAREKTIFELLILSTRLPKLSKTVQMFLPYLII
jgi:hypothetical protein